MKTQITRFTLSVLMVPALLTACSPEDVQRSPHTGPVPSESVVHAPVLAPANSEKLQKVDLDKSDASLKTLSAESSTSVLENLREFVLNAAYVESPTYANDPKMRRMLGQWNRALLALLKSQPASEAAKKYLDGYETVVFSGCDADLRGCVNGSFFRQDPMSARLVEEMARRLEPSIEAAKKNKSDEKNALVLRYYKYLQMSFSLRNKISDSSFEFLYLSHAADLTDAYEERKAQSTEPAGKIQEAIQQHEEIFETLLNRFNPNLTDARSRENFAAFVNRFKPWEYSRQKPNPFGTGATRMLSLAASSFLYEDAKKSVLNPALKAAIDKTQDQDPESYTNVVKKINSRYPGLLNRLGIHDDVQRDEYLFMLDRLFQDHFNLDDASEIWKGSNKDSSRLLKTARTYVKTKIIEMIVETNESMSSIYSQRDQYQSDTLFTTALEKTYPLRTQWNQLLGRIELVRNFINRHLKSANFRLDSEEFRQVDSELSTLKSNIKYLSVYPNMMLMTYFLVEVKGTFTVQTHFGPVDLEAPKMIQKFFNGDLEPFFEFGNDGTKISRLETLYAFYFTLKMDTFRSYQMKNKDQLNEGRFFDVVLGKYFEEDRKMLRDALDGLRTSFDSSVNYPNFLATCDLDRGLLARNQIPGTEGPAFILNFTDLPKLTYMGSKDAGYGKEAYSFFAGTNVVRSQLKQVRQQIDSKLVFIEALTRIMEAHLKSQGVAESDIEKLMKQIKASLNEVEDLKARFLTEALKRYKEVSSCLAQTTRVERDRQVRLLKMEEEHLRQVHRRLQALKSMDPASAQAELQKLNDGLESSLALSTAGLPSDIHHLGLISANEYQYSEFDVLMRTRAHLKQIAPRVNVVMPPDIKDTDLWKRKTIASLSADLSEDEFVQRGLSYFNGTPSAYLHWFSTTENIDYFRSRLKMLVEFYKMGTFEIIDSKPGCQNGTSCRKRVSIPGSRLVSDLFEVLDLLSLSHGGVETEYAKYVRMTGIPSPFQREQLTDFLIDKEGSLMTLAESVYADLMKDEVLLQDKKKSAQEQEKKDKSESDDDPAPIKEAREYYRTQRNQGIFLFTPDQSMKQVLRGRYRPLLMNYVKRIEEFETALKAREKSDAAKNTVVEFGYEIMGDKVNAIKPELASGVPVYLAPQRMGEFRTKMDLFDRETTGFFQAVEGDPDWRAPGGGR